MSDIINALVSQTGIETALAQKGLGAVLSFLKEHLGGDIFGKVQSAIPGSAGMVSSFESAKGGSGGLIGTVAGLAGKLFGGGAGGAKLLESLSHLGFSGDQIQSFLPKVIEQLQHILPADVLDKIKALIPGHATPAG